VLDLGRQEAVRALIQGGAFVDYETKQYKTALIVATESGQIPMINLLLSLGATAIYETRNQKTALTWASASGQMEAMEILLQAEAEMASLSNIPDTP